MCGVSLESGAGSSQQAVPWGGWCADRRGCPWHAGEGAACRAGEVQSWHCWSKGALAGSAAGCAMRPSTWEHSEQPSRCRSEDTGVCGCGCGIRGACGEVCGRVCGCTGLVESANPPVDHFARRDRSRETRAEQTEQAGAQRSNGQILLSTEQLAD